MGSGNDNDMLDWNKDDYCLSKDANLEISPTLWNGVVQNEDEISCMFDESTPMRPYEYMGYYVTDSGNMSKDMRQYRETSSQGKRRRMLQFDDEDLQNPLCNEDISPVFLKSKEKGDSLEEALSDMSQWVSGFADDTLVSGFDGLDHSSEGWLADCFNDTEMHYSPDDTNLFGASNVQTDNAGSCYKKLDCEPHVAQVQRPPRVRRNIVIKGRTPYMKTPSKLPSTIVYPFDVIKPCEAQGDITLKDINKRIHTPPPSKSKEDDDLTLYPMSAFSGKPVVGKTKIRTDGGKGSITIMRTKG